MRVRACLTKDPALCRDFRRHIVVTRERVAPGYAPHAVKAVCGIEVLTGDTEMLLDLDIDIQTQDVINCDDCITWYAARKLEWSKLE